MNLARRKIRKLISHQNRNIRNMHDRSTGFHYITMGVQPTLIVFLMSQLSVILTTLPNIQIADEISEYLVEKELAACVAVIGPIKSVYKWEGKIEKNHEFILKIKCSSTNEVRLIEELKKVHPYKTPEIITLGINSVNEEYLNWVIDTCK